MNLPTVYLAGPITGLNYEGATDWRDYASKELAPDILGVSPMRGKDYLLHEQSIRDHYPEAVLSTTKGITTRDRNDVYTCDAVLMNLLGAKKVTIGTMIEAGWADAFRKPIVLVIEDGNIHWHGMLEHVSGWIVPTLDEGIHIIKTLFWGKHEKRTDAEESSLFYRKTL
jgi:nucleoside 2-deoxyribosyltransferase